MSFRTPTLLGTVDPDELDSIPTHTSPTSDPDTVDPTAIHLRFIGLRQFSRTYYDTQKHRIRTNNRASNFPLDTDKVADIKASVAHTEDLLQRALVANFKATAPGIYEWTAATCGLGPVLMARLLGEVGHPNWAFPSHWEGKGDDRVLVPDPPYRRTVSQLWAYAGHGDPARKLHKGITDVELYALGNPVAKMITHLLAESAMKLLGGNGKCRSPYRDTYDAARAKYESRDWTDGHKHNAALRKTGKEILLDLYEVAAETL